MEVNCRMSVVLTQMVQKTPTLMTLYIYTSNTSQCVDDILSQSCEYVNKDMCQVKL